MHNVLSAKSQKTNSLLKDCLCLLLESPFDPFCPNLQDMVAQNPPYDSPLCVCPPTPNTTSYICHEILVPSIC